MSHDLFGPGFPPTVIPSAYPFDHLSKPAYTPPAPTTTTPSTTPTATPTNQTDFTSSSLSHKTSSVHSATPPTPSTTLLTLANSPSRTPPRSPSDSGSESAPEEIRSAFVPIRLTTNNNNSNISNNNITPSSSSPERISRRPTEGVRNELKAPTTLISQRMEHRKRSPSPTKIQASPASKPVWRPY